MNSGERRLRRALVLRVSSRTRVIAHNLASIKNPDSRAVFGWSHRGWLREAVRYRPARFSSAVVKQSPFLASPPPWKAGRPFGKRFRRQVHPFPNSDDVADHLGLGGGRQAMQTETALLVVILRQLAE